jgi:hypothetical protein
MTSVFSNPHPTPHVQATQPSPPVAASQTELKPAAEIQTEPASPSGLGSDHSEASTPLSSITEPNQVQFGSTPSATTAPTENTQTENPQATSSPAPSSSAPAEEMQIQDWDEPETTEPGETSAPAESSEAPQPAAESEQPQTTSPALQQLGQRFDRDGVTALDDPGVLALLRHVRESEDKNFKSLIAMLQKSLDRAHEQMESNKKEYNQKTLPKLKQLEKELNEVKALEAAERTQVNQQ